MSIFKNLIKVFNKKTPEEIQYEQEVQAAMQLKVSMDKAKQDADMEHKMRMESSVPWYQLVGEDYNLESPPLEPVSNRYTWNAAFIKDLRQQGYKGETDYQVIANWEVAKAKEKAARIIQLERDSRRASEEPWVEVVGDTYDEISKQVAIKLDWNPAFIKMLRTNGYTGRDEEEIVDKWFKRISDQIAHKLHQEGYSE